MRKHYLLISFFVVAGLFMTSCKKDYTCKCTVKRPDNKEEYIYHHFENTTKVEAELGCESQDRLVKLGDPENAKCELE